MGLKFCLSHPNQIKHLKGAVQAIGKIGSDLLIEAIPEQLILRGINSARSAYISVTFHNGFFDVYALHDTPVVQTSVLIKSLLAVFRSQKIRSLEVEVKTAEPVMTFSVECGNGLRKHFAVNCTATEILQASVDKEQFPVTVIAETGELNKLLSTFQSSLDEVVIVCNPMTEAIPAAKPVQLHSFYDPAKGNTAKALRTQLAIDTHHVFLNYSNTLGEATDVTFNVKDFKCMVQLCEAMPANTILRFDQPGQPLVVEPHLNAGALEELQYEAELVLATLMESQSSHLQQDAARLTTPGHGKAPIPRTLQTPARNMHTPGGLSVPGDTPAPTRPGFVTPAPPQRTAAMPSARGGGALAEPAERTPDGRARGESAAAWAAGLRSDAPSAASTPSGREARALDLQPQNPKPKALTPEMARGAPAGDAPRGDRTDQEPAAALQQHVEASFRAWEPEPTPGGSKNGAGFHHRTDDDAVFEREPLAQDNSSDDEEEDEDAVPSTPPEKRLRAAAASFGDF